MSIFTGSAAILAGGESRRMGFDKALLMVQNGRNSLELLANSLSACFSDVFIVRRHGVYEDSPLPRGFRVVYDDIGKPGPLTGLVTALAHSAEKYVFLCACDAQPILPAYVSLITGYAKAAPYEVILPRIGGFVQPFWSLYSASLLFRAREAAALNQQSLYRFIQKRNTFIMEETVITAAGIPISMFSNRNA